MDASDIKKNRIDQIKQVYYSRKDVQKAIYDFSKNREVVPRYFEGFGKRPDSLEFVGDVFSLVRKGATSFHCSEEIWENPLEIKTGMSEKELNELRIGWDFLIDIDCKYFEFAKFVAIAVCDTLEQHGIKNYGVKFSGSKGFHILVPWKAFPKEINGVKSEDAFPDLPRKLIAYLRYYSEKTLKDNLPKKLENDLKKIEMKTGKKCKDCGETAERYFEKRLICPRQHWIEQRRFLEGEEKEIKCPECGEILIEKDSKEIFICRKHEYNSEKNPDKFSEFIEQDLYDLMGLDLILVSPRHLFRAPYSLHEKTSLASCVISKEEIEKFELKDADPLKVEVKNFSPDSREEEAKEFVVQALDWMKHSGFDKQETKNLEGKYSEYKSIKLKTIREEDFPPCMKNILKGMGDGKKRGLFALINFFRSIGMEKEDMEKRILEWNEKNEVSLKKGYVNAQLIWAYRRKPLMPPNCKEFYQGIGVCKPDNLCAKIKNPVNYIIRKDFARNNDQDKKPKESPKKKNLKKTKKTTKKESTKT
jgi:DNA primase catalytic subunit